MSPTDMTSTALLIDGLSSTDWTQDAIVQASYIIWSVRNAPHRGTATGYSPSGSGHDVFAVHPRKLPLLFDIQTLTPPTLENLDATLSANLELYW